MIFNTMTKKNTYIQNISSGRVTIFIVNKNYFFSEQRAIHRHITILNILAKNVHYVKKKMLQKASNTVFKSTLNVNTWYRTYKCISQQNATK